MKKKVGTVLDEGVLRAAKENKCLSQVIEEALREYLNRKRLGMGLVERSRGALSAPGGVARKLKEKPCESSAATRNRWI